jgi:hypothetical protein
MFQGTLVKLLQTSEHIFNVRAYFILRTYEMPVTRI